ncbi:4Fe-4S dicluster domain-containing protein [Mesorhizobium sp. B2-3-4]|uniref:4Fe-4S dicluster domain-containing protein n=1 Tax=Mesorhizobium sp. B2-3-4 TaxID=2589959 RepID=UPI001FEE56B5|nr:4Fe-4S dicluster domain-containing protein [Mesorhizobium sp. B2-3-4]
MGASLSLAGLTACSKAERIVPYVRQPENIIPGRPLYYATTLSSDGYGIGAVVECHEGRPTKVEGNLDHPASRGATDAIMQAAVLSLFDPERSRTPLKQGEPASYDDFLKDIAALAGGWVGSGGQGLALLIEATTSPTTKAQIEVLKTRYPKLRVFKHDPLAARSGEQATATLFGKPLTPIYHFDRADVIVSLDADFLGEGPGRLAYARDFARRRRVRASTDTMSRLYVIESTPTITGAAGDHRRAVKPSAVEGVAAAIKAALEGDKYVDGQSPLEPAWTNVLADDLRSAGRNALVVPGAHQPPLVHAVAFAMNARLGAIGNTLDLIDPPDVMPNDGDLATLCQAIENGSIDTVVVLGSNPVQTTPSDIDVRAAFSKLKLLVHSGLYRDETAFLAHWHIPAAHELEGWSDIRAYDGTASIVQPLIQPLFGGKSLHRLLAGLAGEFDADPRALVRATWKAMDEPAWQQALRDGVVPDSAAASVAVSLIPDTPTPMPQASAAERLEVRFVADPWLRDGCNANSSWLQELPRPLSKLVWGNAALVSPATAERLGLENGRVINMARGGKDLDAPVWITPGQPDETVTLSLGHGRKVGSVASLAGGYDAFALRTADAPWFVDGVLVTPREGLARVVTTQHHQAMEGRAIVRHATLDAFRDNPHFVRDGAPPAPTESLYPDWTYDQEAWGMAIDQSACIGCMACVSACQAENNIPTVGPDQTALGHEMHWLRIDRYYSGSVDDPAILFQPVPCMHCEQAPCEVVCPVNATIHTHDGLNAQVYNRCIGTRYCSQNCPYKVRRFNFLEYQEFEKDVAGPQQAVHNPDVTVRSRGIMEKCTYCVQRISENRIRAQIENRQIGDGEVVTACQQACPTQAIVFGDLNRKGSHVTLEKAVPHNYALLEELNTRPRTTYLGKITNPNGQLAAKPAAETGRG